MQKRYITVILPLKLDWDPCYDATGLDVHVGSRVRVSFAGKEYIGVVSATGTEPGTAPEKIKPVAAVETALEDISPEELQLWKAVSEYYLCSIGEVYKAAYPALRVSQEELHARMQDKFKARTEKAIAALEAKAGKLQERLDRKKVKLEETESRTFRNPLNRENSINALKEDIGVLEKGISATRLEIEKLSGMEISGPGHGAEGYSNHGITLSDRQEKAFEEIHSAFSKGKPVLLNGVTGSGKTEIYIMLAAEAMSEGRNVLYLVPEIALSKQLEDRISTVFGKTLMTFHSGESLASKRTTATAIRQCEKNGSAYIVLGTRSALFLPHNRLGLIIVDEEHDSSYKQDSPAPRYNGRDTAVMLASIHSCNIILGSATPSMESLFNCMSGKYIQVKLDKRYYNANDAEIEIIDTIAERKKRGMTGSFSRKLISRIAETLEKKEQVIILRARRAFSTVMQCTGCGHILKCPHCNVSLSHHRNPDRMVCHYCGYTRPYTATCPVCGNEMLGLGTGTQKIEEEAGILFPEARIARLDSDSAQKQDYETEVIRKFSKGEIDILIGTQIVTKGFDFPNLTLVAVIQADSMLGMQDFRADEKALQILEQFRGRCGRRDRKGTFVIQTSQPGHPVYAMMNGNALDSLFKTLLDERKEFGYPPFTRIVNIILKDTIEERAERMSWSLAADLRKILPEQADGGNQTVTGPYSPAVDKIGDNHIRIIRLCLRKDRQLARHKREIAETVRDFQDNCKYQGHLTMDVDPS